MSTCGTKVMDVHGTCDSTLWSLGNTFLMEPDCDVLCLIIIVQSIYNFIEYFFYIYFETNMCHDYSVSSTCQDEHC